MRLSSSAGQQRLAVASGESGRVGGVPDGGGRFVGLTEVFQSFPSSSQYFSTLISSLEMNPGCGPWVAPIGSHPLWAREAGPVVPVEAERSLRF